MLGRNREKKKTRKHKCKAALVGTLWNDVNFHIKLAEHIFEMKMHAALKSGFIESLIVKDANKSFRQTTNHLNTLKCEMCLH